LQYLNFADYAVMAIYSGILVVMAIYLQRKATENLEAYFLAGRELPWWALGVSGMTNFLDMTGTMVIVSFLYMLGPRGLFIEFRGGAVLVLAFMMLWTGKWHRRSNCMTGAEWYIYRYGRGSMAQAARVITAVGGVVLNMAMLAYLIQGAGTFLSMFLPYSPKTCALAMVALTTLYTLMSGFYGVVYTDLFQSGIILVSVVVIIIMAVGAVAGYDGNLDELAYQVTGAEQWTSSVPSFVTPMPKGYEQYKYLFVFAMFYLLRNILGGMGTGADPRYFGARNERECAKLTFFWTWLMTFRWPMMMGLAVLGLFLMRDLFPDQSVIQQSEIAIKRHILSEAKPDQTFDLERAATVAEEIPRGEWEGLMKKAAAGNLAAVDPEAAEKLVKVFGPDWQPQLQRLVEQDKAVKEVIPKNRWEDKLADIVHNQDKYPTLVAELKSTLGDKWVSRLNMISWEGTINPERILPAVIAMNVPMGWRGLFIISLVAAAMSTFSPTVNTTVALFTRDIYQAFFRPKAGNRELMWASYGFGTLLVAGGFGMAYTTSSINDIWDWIIMGLGGGLAMPGLLRLYWWRFNAGGVVVGTFVGLVGAIVDRALATLGILVMPSWVEFLVVTGIGLIGCIVGTYLTEPTDPRLVKRFYHTTRPFGLWGPLKKTLDPDVRRNMEREHFYDIVSVPFALLWQITLFLLPMQALIGTWKAFGVTFALFAASLVGLYFLWWRNLPPDTEVPGKPFDPTAVEFDDEPVAVPVPVPAGASEPRR